VSDEPVLQGLPPEQQTVFQNSGARLEIPSNQSLPSAALFAALLAFLAASAGLYVGLDYLDADEGMYRHRQLIYAQAASAPTESAILTGILVDQNGESLENYTVVGHLTSRNNVRTNTSDDGTFRLEALDPGQMIVDIQSPEGNIFTNLVLLNSPAAFEPIVFTKLTFEWPSESDFSNGSELSDGSKWIDLSDSQRANETQLYDQTAAALYDMFGTGFVGLASITIALTFIGLRTKSPGLIRTATVTGFFSMGHFYVGCCLGLIGFLATLTLLRGQDFQVTTDST
jgi:hypothetical protein